MDNEPPVFQKFKSEDGEPLESLPTRVSDTDGGRYVLWSDIELAFKGIDSLTKREYCGETRVLFMVEDDAVRLPLCIVYSDNAYHVVLSDEQAQEAEGSHNEQLTMGQTPSTVADQYTNSDHGDIHDPPNSESVVDFYYLLRSFKAL
ncbi:hypothetical protein BG005_011834, partial [Podila minutissima]